MKKNSRNQNIFMCDLCGAELEQEKVHYILNLKLFAAPEIIVGESEFYKNTWEELKKIADKARTRDEQDLQDEVYFEREFHLCKICRDVVMIKIKRKELI